MPTLLTRDLTSTEEYLQAAMRNVLPRLSQLPFSEALLRNLGLNEPCAFFAAILSLISFPPSTASDHSLCRYLLGIPKFYVYLADPKSFDRPVALALCRVMMAVDLRFDVKLLSALVEDPGVNRDVILRILSILDEVSPGGRLTMTLTRVLRDADAGVGAKVAMLLGRRILNPTWVERQLASADARTRANVIETLWGINTPQAKRLLTTAARDKSNRVVGNALVGLHMLHDAAADSLTRKMLSHRDASFRATAAWVMGKSNKPAYRELLTGALADADLIVRRAAKRALDALESECAGTATTKALDGDRDSAGVEAPRGE